MEFETLGLGSWRNSKVPFIVGRFETETSGPGFAGIKQTNEVRGLRR
jgi:hypothetical protein